MPAGFIKQFYLQEAELSRYTTAFIVMGVGSEWTYQ